MRALQRLADLTHDFDAVVAASRDTNAEDEHDPEGATIAVERSQIEALVRQAKHLLERTLRTPIRLRRRASRLARDVTSHCRGDMG